MLDVLLLTALTPQFWHLLADGCDAAGAHELLDESLEIVKRLVTGDRLRSVGRGRAKGRGPLEITPQLLSCSRNSLVG